MTVYDKTVRAMSEVSTYKNPDIDYWISEIDPILKALNQPSIGSDRVDNISMSINTLNIDTSYSVRCCEQTNQMHIPMTILKAENPVRSATIHRLLEELHESERAAKSAENLFKLHTEKAEWLRLELAHLNTERK